MDYSRFSQLRLCTLLIGTILFLVNQVIGQQLPLYLQQRDNQSIINPAALSNDYLMYNRLLGVEIGMRNYGISDDLAPQTGTISGYKVMTNKIGVQLLTGVNVMLDDEGFTQTIVPQLRLAGVFSTNPDREKIVIGLAGGVSQFRMNTTDVKLVDAGDVKGMTGITQWYPDFSLGVFYARRLQNEDNIFGGVSIPQLFRLDKTVSNEQGEYLLERRAHYFAHVGWHKMLNHNSFIEPSLRTFFLPNEPVYADLNLRLKWGRFFWVSSGVANNGFVNYGVGVYAGKKGSDATNLSIGVVFNSYQIGDDPLPYSNNFEVKVSWSR